MSTILCSGQHGNKILPSGSCVREVQAIPRWTGHGSDVKSIRILKKIRNGIARNRAGGFSSRSQGKAPF
jgi:hypothetical protein